MWTKQELIAIYTGSMATAPEVSCFTIGSEGADIRVQASWQLKWEIRS